MIVTEEEAGSKWCPFAQAVLITGQDGVSQSHNRIQDEDTVRVPRACRCAGSACMGWVWVDGEGHPKRKGTCGYKTFVTIHNLITPPQGQNNRVILPKV